MASAAAKTLATAGERATWNNNQRILWRRLGRGYRLSKSAAAVFQLFEGVEAAPFKVLFRTKGQVGKFIDSCRFQGGRPHFSTASEEAA